MGDGIRSETERLTSLVQSHAGAHFTFALVELALYALPSEDSILVCPRTLAKTEMISRAIVQIDDRRTIVSLPQATVTPPNPATRGPSISAEQFYEAMAALDPRLPEAIRKLVDELEALGVYPEYKNSLNLKWEMPSGTPVNLGFIQRNGQLWTETVGSAVSDELAHDYNRDLAQAFGLTVARFKGSNHWYLVQYGKTPRIQNVVERLDQWPRVVEQFQKKIREQAT